MITIVGGGTAGLITALILNQRLSDKIKMVKDENKIIRRRLKKLEGDK